MTHKYGKEYPILNKWEEDKGGPLPTEQDIENALNLGFILGNRNTLAVAVGFRENGSDNKERLYAHGGKSKSAENDGAFRTWLPVENLGTYKIGDICPIQIHKNNKTTWVYVCLGKGTRRFFSLVPYNVDAIDDCNDLHSVPNSGLRYHRNPEVRKNVKRRANGKCEYCGKQGFVDSYGEVYLEAHHIIALAADGEDKESNVIALCPEHHREAHYGQRRDELEAEMTNKIRQKLSH